MHLSDEDIAEYQELYRKRFKKEISYEDAYESANKLIGLLKIVMDVENERDSHE